MAKVIAVFADGTGNSSAKLFKTNVWRLYQALDTTGPVPPDGLRQVAYYHDGVGTSSFRPMAILGGAFGWGLKRNIIDLYSFLCRTYEPDDLIYLFGFSRGAYTVRVLAGLVLHEGLVADSGDAYRRFRRNFNPTGGLVTPLRNRRDQIINWWRARHHHRTYAERQADKTLRNRPADIEFIGVWDTVAAYGTPIAELTRGIDDWIWPLSMPNYQLSPRVRRARHALSLDDERDTFHPLLWDERHETDPDRLKQVWFAGVHSDVGGGYPDDSLAYVSLEWMRQEVPGLSFRARDLAEFAAARNACGPLHDSRRGLGGYYRYQPRKLSARTNPPDPTTRLMQNPNSHARALLRSVNIHESVFERIAHGTDRYAPVVVPGSYQIVSPPGPRSTFPIESGAAARASNQEVAWDWVWHKRVNYFVTVGVSAFLAALPLWQMYQPPTACIGVQCLLSPVIEALGAFLPAMAQPWIGAFAMAPGTFAAAVFVLVLLLARSAGLQTIIRDDMRALWELSMGLPRLRPGVRSSGGWVRTLRQNDGYQRGFQTLKWKILPTVFGVGLLTLAAVLSVSLAGVGAIRASIWTAESSNVWCGEAQGRVFPTTAPCWGLGQVVHANTRYRIHLPVDTEAAWRDREIDTSPKGFGASKMSLAGKLLTPLRRSYSGRWFQPMVKIVPEKGLFAILPLEMQREDTIAPRYTAQFEAPKTGRIYVFVNDVLLPPWFPRPRPTYFYENNKGASTGITLEVVP